MDQMVRADESRAEMVLGRIDLEPIPDGKKQSELLSQFTNQDLDWTRQFRLGKKLF